MGVVERVPQLLQQIARAFKSDEPRIVDARNQLSTQSADTRPLLAVQRLAEINKKLEEIKTDTYSQDSPYITRLIRLVPGVRLSEQTLLHLGTSIPSLDSGKIEFLTVYIPHGNMSEEILLYGDNGNRIVFRVDERTFLQEYQVPCSDGPTNEWSVVKRSTSLNDFADLIFSAGNNIQSTTVGTGAA